MYALFQQSSLRQLVLQQAPAIAVSLVIAELFYKFHSFTLECVAFLATWFIIDFVAARVVRLKSPNPGDRQTPA